MIKIELTTESLVLAQPTIPKEFQNTKGMFEYETLYTLHLLNLPEKNRPRGGRLRLNMAIFGQETFA